MPMPEVTRQFVVVDSNLGRSPSRGRGCARLLQDARGASRHGATERARRARRRSRDAGTVSPWPRRRGGTPAQNRLAHRHDAGASRRELLRHHELQRARGFKIPGIQDDHQYSDMSSVAHAG